jgi:hypothetical protein
MLVLFFGLLSPALGDEHEPFYLVSLASGPKAGGLLYFIDGHLLVYVGRGPQQNSPAGRYESMSRFYAVTATKNDITIQVRPKACDPERQTAKTLDFDGWYLTGDYTTNPPTVKLTKEQEETSYWTLNLGKGPIINRNKAGKETFLVIAKAPVFYASGQSEEDLEYRHVELSFEHKDEFTIEKFDKDAAK